MATQQDADLSLKHFGNQLFSRNPNLVKLSVVAEQDADGKPTGQYYLEAGVISMAVQNASAALDAGLATELVPSELPLADAQGNARNDRVRVNVVQVGEIRALNCGAQQSTQSIGILAFTNRVRPVNGGNSVGNTRYNNAGTFGSVVRLRNDTNNRYFLSNWHVLVGGSGQNGDVIVQPGRLDGGFSPNDVIGTLHWSILDSEFDAALGIATQPWQNFVAHGFRCYASYDPNPIDPSVNAAVTKCGRTSETTTGTILSTNASVNVSGYPTGTRLFTNQIETTSMAQPGDSGSITFQSSGMQPVGLLFAGGSTRTYHNKLKLLFDRHFNSRTDVGVDGRSQAQPEVQIESL